MFESLIQDIKFWITHAGERIPVTLAGGNPRLLWELRKHAFSASFMESCCALYHTQTASR